MIYLDFAKTIETVPHRRLINKLQGYVIDGYVLGWIHEYLKSNRQHVIINGESSGYGRVLGPLPFLVFINGLPYSIPCTIILFADDTKIVQQGLVTQRLQYSTSWCDSTKLYSSTKLKWLLKFNTSKCKFLRLGPSHPPTNCTVSQDKCIPPLSLVESQCERPCNPYW